MTSPRARVPRAWKIRLLGVYLVEPSGLTPASLGMLLRKWTEPSLKRILAPPGGNSMRRPGRCRYRRLC